MTHIDCGFFTEFPWSREEWQGTENNTHNNTWSRIFENFHGAKNTTQQYTKHKTSNTNANQKHPTIQGKLVVR